MTSKTQEPAALRRAETRRSLARLAAMLCLVVLSEMLVGLFATWSLDRLNREQFAQARQALAEVDHARSAQVQFKMQVQAWKNLLLRGATAQDRDTLWQAVLDHEAQVLHHLRQLSEGLPAPPQTDILESLEAVVREHQEVGAGYRAALKVAPTLEWHPRAIDARVRGIDRPLDLKIDALADRLLTHADQTLTRSRETAEQRFDLLEHLMWWSSGLALALIAVLVARALRAPRPES